MSRIETRVQTPLQRLDNPVTPAKPEANPAAAASPTRKLTRLRSKNWIKSKVDAKRAGALAQLKQVLNSDVQPLRDRRREELITDITRILQTIEQIEGFEGEDETTRLCKIMLNEHARRLLLVQGTQIESDGLKGTA